MTDSTKKLSNLTEHQDLSAENLLLSVIRSALTQKTEALQIPKTFSFHFNPRISQVYITLFQRGLKSIRWGSKQPTLEKTLKRIVWKLRQHHRFSEFSPQDSNRCRILFEVVTSESTCNPQKTTIINLGKHRLEPGIHGLKFIYKKQLFYYMPTDAVTNSLMTMNQVYNFLSKRTGIAKKTNKISERVKIMRSLPIDYSIIKSKAFITYKDSVLPLYRGYPVPVLLDKEALLSTFTASADWLVENMKSSGQFLYYYDGIVDSEIDFQHPNMKDPGYYNILRHSGGTITLLRAFELTGKERYLAAAQKSIDFFLSTLREHSYQNEFACYPFFNNKSKLGGAGIGLVSLIHYFRLSGDAQYRKYIDGLARHILSRVDSEGEMIGYFIHPRFHDGKEIYNPSEDEKKELFSFYYPGEALLGLALYIRYIDIHDEELKKSIVLKSQCALNFLVEKRPEKYGYMFQPLPSDGWLMQAIEEWVRIDGFNKRSYIDFVFNDAQAMIDHMYQEDNAPFPDYVGSFFYRYGEHAYPDGARCEGLMAAYYLAHHLGNNKKAEYYLRHLVKAARGLLFTLNTEQSCYAHIYPEKSINSFRFKLTRQWVRVDSVQHTACFYARLYPVIDNKLIDQIQYTPIKKVTGAKAHRQDQLNGFEKLSVLGKGGFSEVRLVRDKKEPTKRYALKQLKSSRNNYYRIIREVNALQLLNHYRSSVHLHLAKKIRNTIYLLLDYAEGGDLKNEVAMQGIFSEKKIKKLAEDILNEIEFAYSNQILHLDISYRNVVNNKGDYSLIDWGLCNQGPKVRTTVIKGNRIYLPPDMYMGTRTLSSEIYSLGCVLYYAATGKHLYNMTTKDPPLAQKVFMHFYFMPEFPVEVPAKIQYLLLRMLDKNPDTRASIREIHAILDANFTIPQYSYSFDPSATATDLTDTLGITKKMATDGIYHAQRQIGLFYERGQYVAQDLNKAFRWYEKAAEKDYAPALNRLARMHLKGKGTAKDTEKAYKLLYKAARQGHASSQYLLGTMFENGKGVKKDEQKARYCFTESAKNSYKKAHEKLKQYGVDIFADWHDWQDSSQEVT